MNVGRLNFEVDGQADLVHHGGLDKAVLAYSADHYKSWQNELEIGDMAYGGFGENLTIQGLTENDVCIGDLWRANDVLFQVSQPRRPCWKLGRRWQRSDLLKRVVQTGRSGWYLRVFREGVLESGMTITLEKRLYPQWTVARTSTLMHDKRVDPEAVAALAELNELSTTWRDGFARNL